MFLSYDCAKCDNASAGYWCGVARDGDVVVLRKLGQSPAWSIEPAAGIARALPVPALAFYRRGLISQSQGFGLGSVTYFRRVVELVTGHLLDLIEQTAEAHGDSDAVAAIAKARRDLAATDRLKSAAALLPANLRTGGDNPLARLYDRYSEAVHNHSDEECAEVAIEMRTILDYVLPALHDGLTNARAYADAMSPIAAPHLPQGQRLRSVASGLGGTGSARGR